MCKRDGFLQVVTGSSEVTGTVQREEEKLFLGNSGFGCYCALMSLMPLISIVVMPWALQKREWGSLSEESSGYTNITDCLYCEFLSSNSFS